MGRPRKVQAQENKRILGHVKRYRERHCEHSFAEIKKALESFFQHTCHKFFYVAGHGSDDLYQEALIALEDKAIPDYVEEKGPFLAFAKLCVHRHIITVLKSANNNRHRILNASISIDASVSDPEYGEDSLCVGHFLSNTDESVVSSMVRDEGVARLRGLLSDKLTPLEDDVFDYYLRNLSYTDIVEEMNRRRRGPNRVDAKVVDNALCRIKKKATEVLMEIDEEPRFIEEEDDPLFFHA